MRLTTLNVRNSKRKEVSSAVDLYLGGARLDFGKGTLNILSKFMVVLPSPFRANGGISVYATTLSFHLPVILFKSTVKVSRDRPRWPKGFRVD